MNSDAGSIGTIQAVRRAVDVLFCFDLNHHSLSAAEVGELLGMNRTTAWRYLQSLAESGLVRPLEEAGRYSLGPRVLRLAEAYVGQWRDLVTLATPLLTQLRDVTGETAALHVRQGWSRIVVTQVESRHELRRTYRDIGEPIPLHLGAPSVAILAWLPDTDLDAYLASEVAADPSLAAEIRDRVAATRRAGYAVSRQARTSDVASVAAPVFDADGHVVGAVNVSGPMQRVDGMDGLADEVVTAARGLSTRLGHAAGP